MSKKKLKNQVITTNINGEIIETTKIFNIQVETSEEFYMSYINNMGNYFNLTAALDYKVLTKLCCEAQFNTGRVNISASMRKAWIEEFNTTNQNISNTLKRLKETELISGGQGSFLINPNIFWKGSNEERKKLMKSNSLQITFEIK